MNVKGKINFDIEIKKIQPLLYSYIFSLCHHKHDSEDILQKTNLILCEKQNQIDASKSFRAWAYKIAKFQVMAHRTKAARSKICFSNDLTEQLADEFVDHNKLALQREALNACYSKLPNHMSTIAELRYKKELSLNEISKITKRSLGSVSATMYRIRSNIKNCIDAEYNKALIESEN